MDTDLDSWDDGETEASAELRFVIENDPDRPWRYVVKDMLGEVETSHHASWRDAKRERKRLVCLYRQTVLAVKSRDVGE